MLPIVPLIGLAAGGVQAYLANRKRKQIQSQIDNTERPVWEESPYEQNMLAQAESQAGRGLSDQATTAYMSRANEGMGNAIGAANKMGADPNSLGAIYSNYQKGVGELALYDEQARQRNLQNVMGAWARKSANADKAFQFNEYAPYADRMAALNQQAQGATNMFNSGLNTAIGGLMGAANTFGMNSAIKGLMPQAQQPQTQAGMMGGMGTGGDYNPMGNPTQAAGNSIYESAWAMPEVPTFSPGQMGAGNPYAGSPQGDYSYPMPGAMNVPGANSWGSIG